MQQTVRYHNRVARQETLISAYGRDSSSRLAHNQRSCANIPGLDPKFPIAVESPHRGPRTIEGGRTQVSDCLCSQLELNKLCEIIAWVGANIIGKAGGDDSLSQVGSRRYT